MPILDLHVPLCRSGERSGQRSHRTYSAACQWAERAFCFAFVHRPDALQSLQLSCSSLSSSGPHEFVVMSRTVRVLRLTFSPSPPLVLLLLFRSLVRLWRGWIIFCLRLFHRQRVTGSSPGSAECWDSIHTSSGCRRLPRHCTISGELVAVALFAVCAGEPGEGIYYQTSASDPTLEGL